MIQEDKAGMHEMPLIDHGDLEGQVDFDRLHQRHTLARQGMFTARFAEAPDQGLDVGVEENDLWLDALILQQLDVLGELFQLRGVIAGVDTDGNPVIEVDAAVANAVDQRDQESVGQVVDTVETFILEGVEGDTLSGPRQTAYYDEFHAMNDMCSPQPSIIDCLGRRGAPPVWTSRSASAGADASVVSHR